jgi:hypothetical protein
VAQADRVTPAPPCAPLLCVLHPSAVVRAAVVAVLPAGTLVASAASPAGLPGAPPHAAVVVLLDPALTAPAEVVASFSSRPTVVSISELRLPLQELGVDRVLPFSRLTEGAVRRLLLQVGVRPVLAGAAR